MRLGTRLGILSIFSTLIPVLGLGFWTAESRYQNYYENIAQQQLSLSKSTAFYIHAWMTIQRKEILNIATEIPHTDDLEPVLLRVLQQNKDNQIAGVFDSNGIEISPHQKKSGVSETQFLRFRDEVKSLLIDNTIGFSDVYDNNNVFLFLYPITNETYLAVEISLDTVEQNLYTQSEYDLSVHALSANRGEFVGSKNTHNAQLMLRRCTRQGDIYKVQYSPTDTLGVLASCSPIEEVPWYIVVTTSTEVFEKPRRDIWESIIIVSVLASSISLLLSGLFIRRLTDPMNKVVEAARTIAMGGFGERVYYHRADEVGDLSDAFNMMSAALDKYSSDFHRQAEILSRTNGELQKKIEERTMELEQAQQKLIQSAKHAAIGEMGAGLAHSLNNPLGAVIGSIQILEMQYPEDELIELMREQTKRCREIVRQWLELSQDVEDTTLNLIEEISLRDIIKRKSKAVANYLLQKDVLIETSEVEDFLFWGDSRIIEQAFTQFFYAIRPFVEKGNNIKLKTISHTTEMVLIVSYKEAYFREDDKKAAGMFYWTAIHYFSTHKIEVKEVKDKEYTWTIHIPRGRNEYG